MAWTATFWVRCKPMCRVTMPADRTAIASAVAGRLIGEGTVVLALLAWWLAARGLPEFILPGPAAVGRRLAELFVMPEFLWHLFTSAWRAVGSLSLARLVGGRRGFLLPGRPWLGPLGAPPRPPRLSS